MHDHNSILTDQRPDIKETERQAYAFLGLTTAFQGIIWGHVPPAVLDDQRPDNPFVFVDNGRMVDSGRMF